MQGPKWLVILLACGPCVVIVNCLGQVLYLGRAPRTKETLPDFRECRVGYPTSTSIPRVDGLSTDTPILRRHKWFGSTHNCQAFPPLGPFMALWLTSYRLINHYTLST